MEPNTIASIAQTHADCYLTFQRLCARAARGPDRYYTQLQDEFDKYKLWAGNVGAAHSGKYHSLSLDYRLREASLYKAQVLKLLSILQRQTGKLDRILAGDRIPFEELSSDSETDTSVSFNLDQTSSGLEDDSPWETSSNSGSDVSLHQKRGYRTDYMQAPVGTSQRVSTDSSAQVVPYDKIKDTNELEQLLDSIRLTVTCIYKLPLRKPAPIDRLRDVLTEEVSCFQHFDALYVRDKFPDQRVDGQIIIALSKMITRRRQLLRYRKMHRDKLRIDMSVPVIQQDIPTTEVNQRAKNGNQNRSEPESSRVTFRTKATTIKMNDEIAFPMLDTLFAPSVAESISNTSTGGASEATRDIYIEVPPRKKNLQGLGLTGFECKYCFLTPYINSDRAWKSVYYISMCKKYQTPIADICRKHVINDLQPYICTFPNCSMSCQVFADQEAWYSHEIQHHRVDLFCNTAGHQTYHSQGDFELHMEHHHDRSLGTSPELWNIFRQPTKAPGGVCNLCFRYTARLKIHVSRHLQQLALFAVPRADYVADGDELDTDSNASQKNARGSQSQTGLKNFEKSFEDSSRDSDSSKDGSKLSNKGARDIVRDENKPFTDDDVDQTEVPDSDEPYWDMVTNKFSQARQGESENITSKNSNVEECSKALHEACLQGEEEQVQLILNNMSNLGLAHGKYYSHALQAACQGGHEKVVRLLLERGADINTQGGMYGNALQAAYFEGHKDLVRFLMGKGASNHSKASESCLSSLEGHSDWVNSVKFSPDSKLVASASCDRTVKVWDIETGSLRLNLDGHTDSVMAVLFSPNGKLIASASEDKTARLWSMETSTRKQQQILLRSSGCVNMVVFSPDSKLVAFASDDKTVKLWNSETGSIQSTFKGHWGSVKDVAFSPNGRLVASASDDETVMLWDAETGSLRHIFKGHTDSVRSVVFSPNGSQIASTSDDQTTRVWNPSTGSLHKTFQQGTSCLYMDVAFSPDGKLLVSAGSDMLVRLWDTATGITCNTFAGHSNWVRAVAFSPSGKLVVSAADDQTIRLWDVELGFLWKCFVGHGDWITKVSFSPDGKLITSASLDKKVKLWNVDIRKPTLS